MAEKRPIRELKPGFFNVDPTESYREAAEDWRDATPEDRDRALQSLCKFAAEVLSTHSPERRAFILEHQVPMSPENERQWREIVQRERAKRLARGD
jgi:hypothetical protein